MTTALTLNGQSAAFDISWIAACGILGLLGVTLLERFVPIVPSEALLVAIGMAVVGGHWSLHTALVTSTAGSLLGCLSLYALIWALGEARSLAVLKRSAWFLGISPARLDRWIGGFRGRERTLVFGSQLIPAVRLLAPGIAALLRAEPRAFLAATTLGVALWNAFFIGVGYAAALTTGSLNASTLAVKVGVILLIGAGIGATAWQGLGVWRRHARPTRLGVSMPLIARPSPRLAPPQPRARVRPDAADRQHRRRPDGRSA
jgi:membrane protein DedA with SNARE-associated domain